MNAFIARFSRIINTTPTQEVNVSKLLCTCLVAGLFFSTGCAFPDPAIEDGEGGDITVNVEGDEPDNIDVDADVYLNGSDNDGYVAANSLEEYCFDLVGAEESSEEFDECLREAEDGMESGEFPLEFGDCDDDETDDPAICVSLTSTAQCSLPQFSACASCINPGATEVCDGVDNDCDGEVDEEGTCECLTDDDCDNGLFCDGAEICVDNVCESGPPLDLDDGVACTTGVCDEDTDSIVQMPDHTVCDNGLFCDGEEVCDLMLGCQPGEMVACDDGLFCNGTETCDEDTDSCSAGTPVDVDDGVSCTIDTCDEDIDATVHTPDHTVCDNGLFCDGTETCDEVLDCQAGMPVVCDDGLFCNGTETCDEDADSCSAGTPVDCDNGLFCDGTETCNESTDSCDAGTPVVCDDGQFCNGLEMCDEDADSCVVGVPVVIDDGVGCTIDSCDEEDDEVVNMPDDSVCDDGLFCNGLEMCDPVADCQSGDDPCDGLFCHEDFGVCDECDSDLDCAPSEPGDLPESHIWGCSDPITSPDNIRVCTSCSDMDDDGFCPPSGSSEICDNGFDDLGNGMVDCDDPSCVDHVACGGVDECTVDTDCGVDEICVDGSCEPEPECSMDSDCPSEWFCIDDVCEPECSTDSDCPGSEVCDSSGVCIDECSTDSDCPGSEICVSGSCEPECIVDADCVTGEVCDSGTSTCVAAPECTVDTDCASGEVCLGGFCVVEGPAPDEIYLFYLSNEESEWNSNVMCLDLWVTCKSPSTSTTQLDWAVYGSTCRDSSSEEFANIETYQLISGDPDYCFLNVRGYDPAQPFVEQWAVRDNAASDSQVTGQFGYALLSVNAGAPVTPLGFVPNGEGGSNAYCAPGFADDDGDGISNGSEAAGCRYDGGC